MRIFDPLSSKQVHCFDSFEGLKNFSPPDGSAILKQGAYKGLLEEMTDIIELYELDDEIDIHKGLVEETLVPFLNRYPSVQFSLVYCDVDLYDPTKKILASMHPRLCKNGVFVMDQWNEPYYPGESTAVREFLDSHGKEYAVEHVSNARQPSLILRKLT